MIDFRNIVEYMLVIVRMSCILEQKMASLSLVEKLIQIHN